MSPSELHRLHLIAEYREITMIPAALRRSLKARDQAAVLAGVPQLFTLNAGHVTFFYNKLHYVRQRLVRIMDEMTSRGYKTDPSRVLTFDGFPTIFYGDWQETPAARDIILHRITQRRQQKPHLYV